MSQPFQEFIDLLDLIKNAQDDVKKQSLTVLTDFSGSDEFRQFASQRENSLAIIRLMMRRMGSTWGAQEAAVVINNLVANDYEFLDEVIEVTGLFSTINETFVSMDLKDDSGPPLVPLLMLLVNVSRRATGVMNQVSLPLLVKSVVKLFGVFTKDDLQARWALSGLALQNLFRKSEIVNSIYENENTKEIVVHGASNYFIAFANDLPRLRLYSKFLLNFLMGLEASVRDSFVTEEHPELILTLCLPLYPPKGDSSRPTEEEVEERSESLPTRRVHPFIYERSFGVVDDVECQRMCIRALGLLTGDVMLLEKLGVYEVLRLRDLLDERQTLNEEAENIVHAILSAKEAESDPNEILPQPIQE